MVGDEVAVSEEEEHVRESQKWSSIRVDNNDQIRYRESKLLYVLENTINNHLFRRFEEGLATPYLVLKCLFLAFLGKTQLCSRTSKAANQLGALPFVR